MEIQLTLDGRTRKNAADCIGAALDMRPIYSKAPSFAFAIGPAVIDRSGLLIFSDEVDEETRLTVLTSLQAAGFLPDLVEEEASSPQPEAPERLCIQMPLDGFTPEKIDILCKLVASKQTLLQKALGAESLPIALGNGTLDFAWFNVNATPEEIAAYTHLVKALCDMAKKQQRVLATDKPVESEKYSFRCFLLRLGFIGEEYASTRRILLQNLSGNGSIKNGQQKPRQLPAEPEPVGGPDCADSDDNGEQPAIAPPKAKRRFSVLRLFSMLKLMGY